jgi:hypothetical protein
VWHGRVSGMLAGALAGAAGRGMRHCARPRPGAPALDVAQAGLGSPQRSTGLVRVYRFKIRGMASDLRFVRSPTRPGSTR